MGNLVLDATASLPTIPHGPLSGQICMSLEEYLETTVCLSVLAKGGQTWDRVGRPVVAKVCKPLQNFANT